MRSERFFSALAVVLLFLCVGGIHSQQRRTRPSRRTTNPVRPKPVPSPTPATSSDPTLISTAGDAQDDSPRRTTRTSRRSTVADEADRQRQQQQEQIQSTVNQLSTKVEQISEDVVEMRNDQRVLFELERLTRAEQRAESLRSQLRDVTDKEFQFQERLAQIADEIAPDAIQRRAALFGTMNPSAMREQIQRSLERERERVQKQLELTTNSRTRLGTAVTTAEAEVERLRLRVEAAEQGTAPTTPGATAPPASPTPTTPTPTPTPAEPPE